MGREAVVQKNNRPGRVHLYVWGGWSEGRGRLLLGTGRAMYPPSTRHILPAALRLYTRIPGRGQWWADQSIVQGLT